MKFVPTENLKPGMRLARPIFNKKGVMLYERDTKLTPQGISSVRNFELIGIYVLEPAEPLPPMTEDDREFERFQTMSVFVLQEIIENILNGEAPQKLNQLSQEILAKFSVKDEKFTFMQNLRSRQDMVYKHSLNVAILAAAIAGKMNISLARQRSIVMTALLHDIGRLKLSENIAQKSVADLTEEEKETVFLCLENGYLMLKDNGNINHEVLRNTQTFIKTLREIKTLEAGKMLTKNNLETEILKVAYYFDELTAMKYGEEPQSDIAAYQYLKHPKNQMNSQVVKVLSQVIHLVPPGCSVQFTNGEKGIVLTENDDDILRPFVLNFSSNQIYNLADGKTFEQFQIKDVLKTLDNRYLMVDEYQKYLDSLKSGESK
ncbi:MAG: HD domain-containing protein [Lachnospiraceae bacterium]|nr:HD domain-containing protein [Lachnospiraceae bacterium]